MITCDAESEGVAIEELRAIDAALLPGQWLDTGDAVQGSILLVETPLDFEDFSGRFDGLNSIFIRHLMPVDFEVALTGTEADFAAICALLPQLAQLLNPSMSFSVQSRILGTGKLPYRKVVLNETLSQALEQSTGAAMDCRVPEQVISIICTPTVAYVGVSETYQNRSAWPGGKHRFKREDDQVSRAEFKLLEAMNVFRAELPTSGKALDIGASPGGWSRLLAERGLQVDAVDPGDLDVRLKGNKRITHLRKRIQDYNPGPKYFTTIVNDMKMDARDSVEIMLRFAEKLSPGGIAVITLKLPIMGPSIAAAKKTLEMVRSDLDRLATGYEIIGARQLYHNRSEVTVVMTSLS